MRGYCARCQEYRSDMGEDAWSIIWKRDSPTCERCGGFVDIGYFVEFRNCKRKNKIYPNNGRPKKHPRIVLNSSRKHGDERLLRGFIKSGFSRNESERKKKREQRKNKADRCE